MARWGFEIFDANGNLVLSSDDLLIRYWYTFTASAPGNYDFPEPLDHEPVVVSFINPTSFHQREEDLVPYAWNLRVAGGKYVGLNLFTVGYPYWVYMPTTFVIFKRG